MYGNEYEKYAVI